MTIVHVNLVVPVSKLVTSGLVAKLLDSRAIRPVSTVHAPTPTVSGVAANVAVLAQTSKSFFTPSGPGISLVIVTSSEAEQPDFVTVHKNELTATLLKPATGELYKLGVSIEAGPEVFVQTPVAPAPGSKAGRVAEEEQVVISLPTSTVNSLLVITTVAVALQAPLVTSQTKVLSPTPSPDTTASKSVVFDNEQVAGIVIQRPV